MTHSMTSNSHKNTPKKLSIQVESILHEKGFSSLFNYSDYNYFKSRAKKAFNKAYAISEMFINDNPQTENDFSEYIF